MSWESFIGGSLSAGVIIVGLSSWLGKVWANRVLEQDKAKYKIQVDTLLQDLRTENSKELYVHRLQFEKEFEIYKELWGAMLELDKAIRPLTNDVSFSSINKKETYSEIRKAFKKLNEIIFINRPFYSSEIFEETYRITELCQKICKCDRRYERIKKCSITEESNARFDEINEELDSTVAEIGKTINNICDKIRQRIWSTNKSGWDRDEKRKKLDKY